MLEVSLNRRYIAKATANIFGIVTGLITAALVPRMLGPTQLGAFSFISTFFATILGLFSAGASQWFFIRLSQRSGDNALKCVYWMLVVGALGIGILFVGVVQVGGGSSRVWPEIMPHWAWLALCLGIVSLIGSSVGQMADAEALTIGAEKLRVLHKIFAVGALFFMYITGIRNIESFFLYSIVVQLLWIAAIALLFRRYGQVVFPKWRCITRAALRQSFDDFWSYCSPLFWLAAFSGLVLLGERWILQTFGGAVEQGYFGLGERTAAMCLLFVAPMVPLFSRELAVSIQAGEKERTSKLIESLVPQMFALSVYFSVFMAVNANGVVKILGGGQFHGAQSTVAIMALYPILQTLGQLLGSVFYAAGETRMYRNISAWFGSIGLVVAFFLLAPGKWGGLNLAASGLALRTVGIAVGTVIALLILSCRLVGLSSMKLGLRLFLILAGASAVALVGKTFSSVVADWRLQFLCSGILYSGGIFILALLFPKVLGYSWVDLVVISRRIRAELLIMVGKRV